MRPYPDELLRSVRHSLREVVIPAIEEPWPRYVAKAMEKLLEHLELRALHEERLLAEDNAELDDLFRLLGESFAAEPLVANPSLSAWRALPMPDAAPATSEAGDGRALGLQALNEGNEARRAHLVAAIEAMDASGQDGELESCRTQVRSYLRRELDRDVVLTRPTFMSFAPPAPRSEGAGA